MSARKFTPADPERMSEAHPNCIRCDHCRRCCLGAAYQCPDGHYERRNERSGPGWYWWYWWYCSTCRDCATVASSSDSRLRQGALVLEAAS